MLSVKDQSWVYVHIIRYNVYNLHMLIVYIMRIYVCVYNIVRIVWLCIIPKTKKFGCVGRGDLTFLFKSCEIYESQGRLI